MALTGPPSQAHQMPITEITLTSETEEICFSLHSQSALVISSLLSHKIPLPFLLSNETKVHLHPIPMIDTNFFLYLSPRSQRLNLHHNCSASAMPLLNLSASSERDRFKLKPGMKLIFQSRDKTNITSLNVVSIPHFAPPTSTTSYEGSRKECHNQRVSFASHVRFRDEYDATSQEPLSPVSCEDENEEEIESIGLWDESNGLMYSCPSTGGGVLMVNKDIPLPEAQKDSLVEACVVWYCPNVLFLLLPRISFSSMITCLVELPQTSFPLANGDVIHLPSSRESILKVTVPNLLRSIPKPSAREHVNPMQATGDLVLGFSSTWQEKRPTNQWKDSTSPEHLLAIRSTPKLWWFPASEQTITFGSESMVHESDRTLARHHATVSKCGNKFAVLKPVSSSRAVRWLLGRGEENYRGGPLALRVGDSFNVGLCEYMVVFQQRGNRLVLPKHATCEEEFLFRLHTKALEIFPPRLANEDEDVLATKLKQADASQFPGCRDVDSLLSYFNLNIGWKEKPLLVLMSLSGPCGRRFWMCNPLETVLGRSSFCNISVTSDKRMSPVHARIFFDQELERWMLEDLSSTHGTFVKVSADQPFLLCPGDVFCLGSTEVTVLGKTEI